MINIEEFDSNFRKIGKKSYKNIYIYYIGYITMKDSNYVKVNSVNPLYLIIDKVDGYTVEKNGNKYLAVVSTDKNKEVLIRYTKLWDKIKNLIEFNSIKLGEYEKDFMKIKFNSDHNLPLNKTLKIHNMKIIIISIFEEDGKYYPQVFLDERLYELEMLVYDRIDISEGIDFNKTKKNMIFVIIGILKILVLNMNDIFAVAVMI